MSPSNTLTLLHFGAGNHAENPEKFKRLFRRALKSRFPQPDGADHVVSQIRQLIAVSSVIEDSSLTNTGVTSSIARDGSIQSDSSIFVYDRIAKKHNQSSLLANTAARPITECAYQYFAQQKKNELGLTPPVTLVGVTDHNMKINGRMNQLFEKYRNELDRIDSVETKIASSIITDTIGVSVIDKRAASTGVSSGGSLFKKPGRIGCSGVVGAGCYTAQKDGALVNVLCSGNGEDIIQMDLARSVCRHILANCHCGRLVCDLAAEAVYDAAQEVDLRALDDHFNPRLYVGVVGYFESPDQFRTVFYFHTTETFVFGYATGLSSEFCFSTRPKLQAATKGQMYVK
ncbi:hypothetical protein KL949_004380 [Ogataea haglerorum]|nr:hypothetical protein KL915_001523 [Ogataea haglerorum]KAG7714696.1 hypothetical protein KL913_004466 [Ogataea haglerorum]KAG7715466.1 hypothetical protein KL949_004380 [Ogataea haglerorum]KAG7755287.1 hypothetical protein KL947_004475 [Ogataea haglerorum]KAG7770920.1 hypothetical protein KL931_001742 [Ogataea haglerorum]